MDCVLVKKGTVSRSVHLFWIWCDCQSVHSKSICENVSWEEMDGKCRQQSAFKGYNFIVLFLSLIVYTGVRSSSDTD